MAKGSFDNEIKSSMQESPADRARDKAAGIKEGSAQDQRLDAKPQNQMPPGRPPPHPPVQGMPQMPGHSIPHINAAASIAHAILNRS